MFKSVGLKGFKFLEFQESKSFPLCGVSPKNPKRIRRFYGYPSQGEASVKNP